MSNANIFAEIERLLLANGATRMSMAGSWETTGKRIFWLRREVVKIKQKELAKQLGISPGFLSDIESDGKSPSADVLIKLADALHTTMDYLMLRTDNPAPIDEEIKPTYLAEEAEQAAALIDRMYPRFRQQALGAVTGIYDHHKEHTRRDRTIDELLAVIESTRGENFRRAIERQIGLDRPHDVDEMLTGDTLCDVLQ